ncbi:MAG: HPP family protein [Candidatus Scalindua rubra]|uniref:HPP family protein n=1 Tax=Candidatus Scalindua rubra TaxID=1872076 RepID=A0A1E3X4G7_9BACT|nr:MAG: HPP family protein [Candidatus Scalindua rubra]
MKIFDEKFRKNKLRYMFQCFLATLSVFIILLLLDNVSNAITIASLGSSTFIVFTMPDAHLSKPRFLIGGYMVSIAMGMLCHQLPLLLLLDQYFIVSELSHVIFGSLSVGLAIFVMVITDTEHPPAAGLALALILDEWSYMTIAITMVGIISLSALKALLKPFLRNLL